MIKLNAWLAGIGLALAGTAACAQPINLTLAGASPQGLWTLVGTGLDQAVKKAHEGSTITYQTSGGGFANVGLVDRGQAQLGLVHDAELKIALAGQEPFKKPVTDLRAIGYMYNWAPMHFFITKRAADQHGIRSLADIAAKKVPLKIAVNRPGNITGQIALAMLDAAGVSQASLRQWGGEIIYAGSGDQAKLMSDNRVDVITNGIFVGHSSFRQVDNAQDIVLLTVPKAANDRVNQDYGTQSFTIPKGSYKLQDADVETIALGAMIVAHRSMDEALAERLTRAMIENVAAIQGVHPSMKALTPKIMASQRVVEFHPGAAKAYRAAKLLD